MNYWLSILIPSSRKEGLEKFLSSLMYNSLTYNNIQIIVLQDGDSENIEYSENVVLITRPKDKVLSIAKLQEECFKYAVSDWIMLGNDDVICETKGWDSVVQSSIKEFEKDGIGLIWPNDNMFGSRISCFPIFHRKVFNLIYPLPYRRYKVDDTIFSSIPNERKRYLENIMFRHENDKGVNGFQLDKDRIYPIDSEAAKFDNAKWDEEAPNRYKIRRAIRSVIGTDIKNKVLIGISTMEMARRADFYDYVDLLNKPEGTHLLKTHGQSPAIARNLIFREAFNQDCTHVLLLDDDIAFKSDMLLNLMKHDKEVVCGLQLMRQFPHKPIIFDHFEDKHAHWRLLKENETGLIPIVAAGLGCCLIRLSAIEDMEQPWIRLGEIQKDNWCDDIGFWGRLNSQDMWCDLDTPIGHNANITIWPNKIGTAWYSSYDSSGIGQAHVPQEKYNDSNRTNKAVESAIA